MAAAGAARRIGDDDRSRAGAEGGAQAGRRRGSRAARRRKAAVAGNPPPRTSARALGWRASEAAGANQGPAEGARRFLIVSPDTRKAVPVGIGMTLHNRAGHLREAVDSLLAQSYANFKLVLVDDGSTDETETIARSCERSDERVEYIRLPERRGMVSAWRTAFELATSNGAPYFAWASDHDRWHPRWLEDC